ncbi:glycoside hydrolase family 2 TIM barrel-domain containing protein [Luteolibacter sp. LG18]|uniref:glycoside hydrolase family 2 protein n=1 Tax=Luteolibacter sp. LG18 TaxID=2819286 RepID=UPI002B283116|nr:beta-galactosidase [Luteolibacter sp. LG18]
MSPHPLLLSTFLTCIVAHAVPELRETINFNRDWKYQTGDPNGAEAPAFDDHLWDTTGVPHSFSTPYFMAKDFPVGYGWYRKSFELPAGWERKRVALEFEAAFQEAEIFVNGRKAGRHRGGYSGFPLDITDFVKPGANTVAIRLNNLWQSDLAPRAGEHVFSGGLYRNVRLVATHPVHVTWFGTFVTTPEVSATTAKVNVKTEVTNHLAAEVQAELETVILDPDGKVAARTKSKLPIAGGTTVVFDQTPPAIPNPKRWDIGTPTLYRAISQLSIGGKAVDHYETPFGIRSIRWTADQGFFLNDKHVYLRGANVHQDQAGWGDAVPDSGHRRDVKLMQDAGFNFLRGSHYPPPPARTRACDELGMLYWAENCFWGIGGSPKEGGWNASAYPIREVDEKPFADSLKDSLRAMIRVHRNHPSVIAWSMSNEPFFSDPKVAPKIGPLLQELVALSRELDPTRPAAIGGAQRPIDDKGRIDRLGDIAGYNGDGATIPAFQNPGFATVVSEYGSVTADRPGKYAPNWGSLAKDNGQPVYPWRAGQAIWCGFDHGSIAGAALGKMGIVDYFRIPKRAWFWYRNENLHLAPPEWPKEGKPAGITLTADKTSGILTDGTDDTLLTATIVDDQGHHLSNSPPLELTIVSGPGEFPTGPSIRFENGSDIRIQDGQAAIAFRAWQAGTTVVSASSPGLKEARLTLTFTGPVAYIPGTTAKARPYLRGNTTPAAKVAATYGPNNPTLATSSAPGSASGLAADGKSDTAWQPDPADRAPALTLDTEKGLLLSQIGLTFPDNQPRLCRVEVSTDQARWTSLPEFEARGTRDIPTPPGTHGRYVRVSFPDPKAAALSEIRATGTVDD